MGEAKYLICLSWQVLDHCGGFIFRRRINLYYLFGSAVLGETVSKKKKHCYVSHCSSTNLPILSWPFASFQARAILVLGGI